MSPKNLSSDFIFVNGSIFNISSSARRAMISCDIGTEIDLFDKLAYDLSFPDYFGRNWNALDECLRDFHWLDDSIEVEIIHQSLPSLPDEDLGIYLDVLAYTVKQWHKRGQNRLHVFFPSALRDRVEHLLKMEQQRTEHLLKMAQQRRGG